MKMRKLFCKFLHSLTLLALMVLLWHNSSFSVECVVATSSASRAVFDESARTYSRSSSASTAEVNRSIYASALSGTRTRSALPTARVCKMIHVKFRTGTNIDSPLLLLPPELRKSVDRITRLFSLSDQQLERMGAPRLKLWFEITLKPETDMDVFLENIKRLDHVEVAEQAPRPVPPPSN
jgi:hypothetical protein